MDQFVWSSLLHVDQIGELSIILRHLKESPVELAARLRTRFPDLQDAVPCYDTIGLYFARKVPTLNELETALACSLTEAEEATARRSKRHIVPVCYAMGPDLALAASRLELSEERLVAIHSAAVYRCAAVGFVPGFAYLGPLDPRIARLPRLDTPRRRVEEGTVAIAGDQTAVYPSETPGGWRLIGRTPLKMADEIGAYYPIAPGDEVMFEPIDETAYQRLEGKRL